MSLTLPPTSGAGSPLPLQIAALDWTSAQNLLALGANVITLPERTRYSERVVEPEASPNTHDLGLRSEPNLELLDSLAPDLIVLHPELDRLLPELNAIAPAILFDPDANDDLQPVDRLANARVKLERLADEIARSGAFSSYINAYEATISEASARLRGYDGRAIYIVTLLDTRRALVFGKNSLFQNLFDQFSIENAWDGPTSFYGHATVTIDALARQPHARLLSVGRESRLLLQPALQSPVIASLPYVREKRAVAIDDVLFYGGLPSAQRFARLASFALTDTVAP